MKSTRYKRDEDYGLLTPREEEILKMVRKGLQSKDISLSIGVLEKTVKFHLTNIYRKLGVSGRRDLGICRQDIVDGKHAAKPFSYMYEEKTDISLPKGLRRGR